MELRWLGHACFPVAHAGYTLCIDPYNSDYVTGYPRLRRLRGGEAGRAPSLLSRAAAKLPVFRRKQHFSCRPLLQYSHIVLQ